jgi:hypothetical protein
MRKISSLILNIPVFIISGFFIGFLSSGNFYGMLLIFPAVNIISSILILRLLKVFTVPMVFAVVAEFLILVLTTFLIIMHGMH